MTSASRRRFLTTGAGALCAAGTAGAASAAAPKRNAAGSTSHPGSKNPVDPAALEQVLAYGRSYVTFVYAKEFNFARLEIDARCILLDSQGRVEDIFYRFASCKSEDTHSKANLFMQPNYDFSGVFSRDYYILFRVKAPHSGQYAERAPIKAYFERVEWDLRYEADAQVLKDNSAIVEATRAAQPLVGRTEISDEQSGRRAILEYPIKTMNVNLKRQIYQVDTGPLAYPDFKAKAKRSVDMIELAFVAYNRPDDAYFIVQRPTPVARETGKAVNIYHYSEAVHLPARNTLYAMAPRD